MKTKTTSQIILVDSERFNKQAHLIKYIAGYEGYNNVKVSLAQDRIGKKDVDILTVYSDNQGFYEIIQKMLNHIFELSFINDSGELIMAQPVCTKLKKKESSVPLVAEWYKTFNKILLDFITESLTIPY